MQKPGDRFEEDLFRVYFSWNLLFLHCAPEKCCTALKDDNMATRVVKIESWLKDFVGLCVEHVEQSNMIRLCNSRQQIGLQWTPTSARTTVIDWLPIPPLTRSGRVSFWKHLQHFITQQSIALVWLNLPGPECIRSLCFKEAQCQGPSKIDIDIYDLKTTPQVHWSHWHSRLTGDPWHQLSSTMWDDGVKWCLSSGLFSSANDMCKLFLSQMTNLTFQDRLGLDKLLIHMNGFFYILPFDSVKKVHEKQRFQTDEAAKTISRVTRFSNAESSTRLCCDETFTQWQAPSVDWHTCSFVSVINPTVLCMWLCQGSLWPPNQKLNNYLAQVRFSCIETRSSSPTV